MRYKHLFDCIIFDNDGYCVDQDDKVTSCFGAARERPLFGDLRHICRHGETLILCRR